LLLLFTKKAEEEEAKVLKGFADFSSLKFFREAGADSPPRAQRVDEAAGSFLKKLHE
jgi:hypothetical protein